MQTGQYTKLDPASKAAIWTAMLTIVGGYVGSLILPAYISSAGLNLATGFFIFVGALAAALAIAKIKEGNHIVLALTASVVSTIVIGLLYMVIQQGAAFAGMVGFVFGGTFIGTIIGKRVHKM